MWIKVIKRRVRYKLVNLDTGESSWDRVEEWYDDTIWVGKKKYQKKPHHKKKALTEKEVAKNDWRKELQLKKDKAKPTWGVNGYKKFCKRYGWKCHRKHTKQALRAGNYDILHHKDYKHFVDPWDWD